MAEYVKSLLLSEDVVVDEVNPKFRFFFNTTHCLKLAKYTFFSHAIFTLLPILYCLPYTLPTIPIYCVVFIATIFGIKSMDALALLPIQIWLITLFVLSASTILVDPLIAYYYRESLYKLFNYDGNTSAMFLLLILSNIMMAHIIISAVLFWQYQSIVYCRDYLTEVREKYEYNKLSVPETFLNTTINETMPLPIKKAPTYTIFTMADDTEDVLLTQKPSNEPAVIQPSTQ